MKKIALFVAGLFAAAGIVAAQAELANFLAAFVEEGRATWEITEGGLQASHPSLPIGSTPTIRNTATGREIAVTVTGRMPVSTERVIDISADAARAIGLEPGGLVLVYFPPPAVVTMPETQPAPHGINITIHNHVIPHSVWLQRQAPVEIPPEPEPEPGPPSWIIPGWPDPYSDRIYNLQVGTWPNIQSAFDAFLLLRTANFNAIQEYAHGMYRAYAASIPAAEVFYAAHRLRDLGFAYIYVREQ